MGAGDGERDVSSIVGLGECMEEGSGGGEGVLIDATCWSTPRLGEGERDIVP